MKIEGTIKSLKIYIGEQKKHHHESLYEVIATEAKKMGLAGITIYKGILGYGAASHIHTSKIIRLSEDLPIIIEIIDSEEKIKKAIPVFNTLLSELKDVLITLQDIEIIEHTTNG
jgi:uncharacterized protein